MDPKHHQLQHPQAELLRLMMPFTHSCKASRQGGALSPICWGVTGASSKRALANLPSTLGVTSVPPLLLRPSDLMSQGISTEVGGALCCGQPLSQVASLSEGSPFLFTGMELHSPFNADEIPRPFHFTSPPFGTSVHDEFLTPGLRY